MRIGDAEAIVTMIVPCLDEEAAIGTIVADLVFAGFDEVIVVDGGSHDRTVAAARGAGATVLIEPRRGYGRACATGVAAARMDAKVIAFMDGDGSDDPAFVPAILGPVVAGQADFVMASRVNSLREGGSLTPQQLIAGRLAGFLIRITYGTSFTDMAPFRAIRRDVLRELGMAEATFGWNLEMQMRVAARQLRVRELPVRCRRRFGGVSKVSGNPWAALPATWALVCTFVRLWRAQSRAAGRGP